MQDLKGDIERFEGVRNGKHLGLRRAFNALVRGGGSASGTLNIDKGTQTVFLLLGKEGAVPDKKSKAYRSFLSTLKTIRSNGTFEKMYRGSESGVNSIAWVMNLAYYMGEPITTSLLFGTRQVHVLPPARHEFKASKGKVGGGNQKNKNGSNQYNIFDSQPPLRKFVMQRLQAFLEKRPNATFLFVDPCAGLGRLTPTSKDVSGNRVLAYDLVVPRRREEIYGDYRECRETVCQKGAKWSQLKQPGVGKIHEQDFFASSPKTYGKTTKEGLVFVMNPPFRLPKSKGRTTSGVLEFVKQCCRVVGKGGECDVFTICQKGFTDWYKKDLMAVPDHVEIVTAYTFVKGKDPKTYFMRVNECKPGDKGCVVRYDMMTTDMSLVHLRVHRVGKYSRKSEMKRRAPEVHELLYLTKGEHRMDAIKDKMLRKFGYWVGTILDDQPWFDQTREQRSCPDVVRSYGNTDRLGEGLQGCPNHSAVRTDDAAAIRKYKAWGWSVGKKSQKKVQRELKWKQSLAPMS